MCIARGSGRLQAPDCAAPEDRADFPAGLILLSLRLTFSVFADMLEALLCSAERFFSSTLGFLIGFVERRREIHMNGIIYLVGLVVIILFVLSFFGLR